MPLLNMTRNNSMTRRSTKGLEKDKKKEKSKEKKGIECIQVIDNGDLDNDVNKVLGKGKLIKWGIFQLKERQKKQR